MRLGIDLDGVVADFNAGWISRYNTQFESNVLVDHVDRWDVIPHLTHFRHMGEFWDWAADLDGASLFRHLEPYPGAIDALWRLARKHDIVVITTKPHFAIHDTFEWIAEHRLPTREVHITERKSTVAADIYLDDGPHNLYDLVDRRPEATVVRFERPWNDHVHGTFSVDSWPAFEELVSNGPTNRR